MHAQKIAGMVLLFGRYMVIDMISMSQDRPSMNPIYPAMVPHPSMSDNA